jgi:hypothetical protein
VHLLRPGQETVLAWNAGAIDCHVVASAGSYVLLRLGRGRMTAPPSGACSLTYLDGMTPMGWDGAVEPGAQEGEVRFRLQTAGAADRRASVRLPVGVPMDLEADGAVERTKTLDISAGGMRFHHAGLHPLGTVVHVRVALPNGPLLDADAIVRASEPMISSVEFTTMHGASAAEVGAWTVAQLRSYIAGQG